VNLAELLRFWQDQLAALDAGGRGGPGTAALRADIHTDLARLGHALGSPEQQVLDHLRAAASEHHRVVTDPTADPSLRAGARAELVMALSIVAGTTSERLDIARAIRQTGAGAQERAQVAEALAALLLEQPLPPSQPVASARVRHQLAACEAIARADASGFSLALTDALQAEGPDDAPSTDSLLAITELAIGRLAIEREIVILDELPLDPALPRHLSASACDT